MVILMEQNSVQKALFTIPNSGGTKKEAAQKDDLYVYLLLDLLFNNN
jgi:hypothetical protein